ncbi:GNAT family N-acetyltransferase [Curtobacterium sp. PvP017]
MDEVTVAVLDLAAVEAVERREPAGRQYVRPAFAAQTRGEQTVLVAWIDGVPVGSGEVTADVRPEFRNLRVDADRRGQGVGTRLIAAAEALATDRGVLRIGVALEASEYLEKDLLARA